MMTTKKPRAPSRSKQKNFEPDIGSNLDYYFVRLLVVEDFLPQLGEGSVPTLSRLRKLLLKNRGVVLGMMETAHFWHWRSKHSGLEWVEEPKDSVALEWWDKFTTYVEEILNETDSEVYDPVEDEDDEGNAMTLRQTDRTQGRMALKGFDYGGLLSDIQNMPAPRGKN